ncbi:ribosome maturation factor RimP [Halobacillus yeomjeoni]|uniref:Ribosome maturation factor RimP n=1 Tax=Halobacillus yeomjeoni TaxID=311194 RepID=A0A931HTS7_9BACI|nr:ribosome maturation factor RimP [Halobacillus yeomjeoni]MBH0229311.1 ribosome maturation factor RimP [Halobacillus yeomjeoni]MCA0983290.1 ribosome maturation factor RimP [Halobacillus yeomjeoni]
MSNHVTSVTEKLVQPILDEMNLELVDIEYKKEGQDWFLRVFIDKPGGVDIEECGIVNEKLSEKLDEEDPIDMAYFLDVSSPGAERPLKTQKDFEKYVGEHVYMKLYEPIDGEKEFEGTLVSFENETAVVEIRIKTRKKQLEVPFEKIAKANLAVTFN